MTRNPPLDVRGTPLYWTGAPLAQGPLPAIFYFALSGPDSLYKDPYNQPAAALSHLPIRVFSLTLPGHENDLDPNKALSVWAQDLSLISRFLAQAEQAIEFAIDSELAHPEKIGVAGLSRGGLIASLLAIQCDKIKAIVEFAPITNLSLAKDFAEVETHPFDLYENGSKLADKAIRFYIGNKDTRVSTKSCVDFAMRLIEQSTLRTPKIELILSPSIGMHGHGTPPHLFKEGALWLAKNLE